jgi:hypothetical protein
MGRRQAAESVNAALKGAFCDLGRGFVRVTFDLTKIFGPLDGQQVPGGCDDCHACQTLSIDPDGIWHVRVHHDHWCPWLAAHQHRLRKGDLH